jgi:hypothetical protein
MQASCMTAPTPRVKAGACENPHPVKAG